MIEKLKWKELQTQNNERNILNVVSPTNQSATELRKLLTETDVLLSNKLGYSYSNLLDSMKIIVNDYINPEGLWEELPIYVSSYKKLDKRPYRNVYETLFKYLLFYNKVLTDTGFARTITSSKNYNDTGSQAGTNKNYVSETPQTTLDNFDEMIEYASSLTKDENNVSTSRGGTSSGYTIIKSYDEEVKNLNYLIFNSILDYILNIPNYLYSYYALDTMPYPDLVKMQYKTLKEMYK